MDQKGTMVADCVEFGVDNSSEHGEDLKEIVAQLKDAQEKGIRVKLTVQKEVFVGLWRSEDNKLVTKVEILP